MAVRANKYYSFMVFICLRGRFFEFLPKFASKKVYPKISDVIKRPLGWDERIFHRRRAPKFS